MWDVTVSWAPASRRYRRTWKGSAGCHTGRKVRKTWFAWSVDLSDLLFRRLGVPSVSPSCEDKTCLPFLPWLLANCSRHCMKTPWQSLTQAKFPYYCLLLQILLFLRSHRFVFLKYKNLLSKAMGHQLCFGRKSVCAEISVKRSGGTGLALPKIQQILPIWGWLGPLLLTDGWPTNVTSQHWDSGGSPLDEWPSIILLERHLLQKAQYLLF